MRTKSKTRLNAAARGGDIDEVVIALTAGATARAGALPAEVKPRRPLTRWFAQSILILWDRSIAQ
jgi:hypothetical protein